MRAGLPLSKHYTEQHLISQLAVGESKQVDDIRTATVETFETLNDVWVLYNTLAKERGDGTASLLTQFNFLMEWPKLSDEKKAEKYSEFSCHELNFFVYQKDRAFFQATIKPFLKDKLAVSAGVVFILRMHAILVSDSLCCLVSWSVG